jgi:hypothetical protein
LLLHGGSAVGFPNLLSITTTPFNSATTNHAANFPATVNAGDLIVALVSSDGTLADSAVTTPGGGWVAEGSQHQSGGGYRISVFSLIAAGTEGGTTVNFVTAGSEEAIVSLFRIQAGTHANDVEATFFNASSGGSSIANPALTPTWGSANTLWGAAIVTGGGLTVTSYPLPDNQAAHIVPAMAKLGYSTRLLAASTLTPANWGLSTSIGNAVTATFGVRPVSG